MQFNAVHTSFHAASTRAVQASSIAESVDEFSELYAVPQSATSWSPLGHRRNVSWDFGGDSFEDRRRSLALSVNAAESLSAASPNAYNWISCQQKILSILQGNKIPSDERSKIANSLSDLSGEQIVPLLIGYCKDEVIPGAMEAHANRLLHGQKDEKRIYELASLWDNLYQNILPDAQAVLAPFERMEKEFNSRKFMLTCFRNHVLLPVSEKSDDLFNNRGIPSISQMLMVLSMMTRDGTEEYTKLTNICNQIWPQLQATPMGQTPMPQSRGSSRDWEPSKSTTSFISEASESSISIHSTRSKRSVHFDERKISAESRRHTIATLDDESFEAQTTTMSDFYYVSDKDDESII